NTNECGGCEDLELEILAPKKLYRGDLEGVEKWKEIASAVLTTKDSIIKESSQKFLRQPTIEEIIQTD
ncbi:1663_t:CDS:2, partial [Racocetra persica]